MPDEKTFGHAASPLDNHIEALTRDSGWTLAHFAFVAAVTTLEAECDIAHSPTMSVAYSHHSLPLPTLSFLGNSPGLLETYATFLVDPGGELELVVNETQCDVARAAFDVQHVEALWQMVFRSDPPALEAGRAIELTENDLPSMQALATSENVELRLVAKNPFGQGPAFGIWEKGKLVAMGTTNVRFKDAIQIGNIIAHDSDSEIATALVNAHAQDNATVFIVVLQSDEEAVHRFENLGFVCERAMYRMRCILETIQPP